MENSVSWVVFLIPIAGIVGGFFLAGLGIYSQIRRREFEHRERLAMIEKGIAPPAPATPAPEMSALPTSSELYSHILRSGAPEVRARRGGFILVAIGVGLAFLIWMTSQEQGPALGVGGFMVILGGAIFLSSFFGGGGRRAGTPESSRR